MIRIAVDCRFSGGLSGLGSYTRAITSHLVDASRGERYVLIVRSDAEEWLNPLRGKCDIIVADIPHYSLAEQTQLPGIIRKAGVRVLFSPHFNVPFLCPVPSVVTIHDLILHRYPNSASLFKRLAYRVLIRHAIQKARAVIAISSFVGKEIAEMYGPAALAKTSVILNGVEKRFTSASEEDIARVKQAHNITRPYFLYIGNAKQHKNVRALVEGYAKSGVRDADLLLVTGGSEAAALEPLPDGCRFVRTVSDADLPALYSGARAFVTASLYEGFCLPVAEALACGTPVIASDRSAIPEIASGHALLIEPDAEHIARALHSALPKRTPYVSGRWEDAAGMTRTVLLESLIL